MFSRSLPWRGPGRVAGLIKRAARLGAAAALLLTVAGPRADAPHTASADTNLNWEGIRPPYSVSTGTTAPYATLTTYGATAQLIQGTVAPSHHIVVAPNGDIFTSGRSAAGDMPWVFKSTDGGRSWNRGLISTAGTVVTGLAVSPKYPSDNLIFASFSDGAVGAATNGVAVSTNGGTSFTTLASFGPSGFNMQTGSNPAIGMFNVTAIAISPNFDNSTGAGMVVIAGSALSGSDVAYQLKLNPGGSVDPNSGSTRPLRFSGGSTTGGTANSLALAFSPDFSNDGVIGLLYTCDGSVSTERCSQAGTFVSRHSGGAFTFPAAPDLLGNPGFVATTGGLAFPNDYFDQTGGGIYYAATGNGTGSGAGDIFKHAGGVWASLGRSADFAGLAAAGSGSNVHLLAPVDSTGVAGAGINLVHRSTNGGASFATTQSLDGEKNLLNVTGGINKVAMAPDYLTSSIAYGTLPGTLGGVVKTTNKGANWVDTGLANEWYTTISSLSVSAAAPGGLATMSAGGNRSLFWTDNLSNVSSWVRIHRAAGTSWSYHVPTDFKAQNTLYAYNVSFTSAMIIKSADGGRTWDTTSADPFSDARVTAMGSNGAARLIIGDDKGRIWNSSDGGGSWQQATTVVGNRVTSFRMQPDFTNSHTIAAAAIVGGVPQVFLSTDGATTFTQVGNALGAWGTTSSSTSGLTIRNASDYHTNQMLYVRCNTCSDTDIWRIKVGAPAGDPNQNFNRLGVPSNVRPLGHHTFFGSTLYMMGSDPNTFDPGTTGNAACFDANSFTACSGSNMQYRTVNAATITDSTWNKLALASPPVMFGQNQARVSGSITDVAATASGTTWWYATNDPVYAGPNATTVTQIMSLTWTNDFLAPIVLNQPANAGIIATNVGDRGMPATFTWQPVNRAQCYDFQLALDQEFVNLLVDPIGAVGACPSFTSGIASNPSLTIAAFGSNSSTITVSPLVEGNIYYWRVRVRSIGLTAPGTIGQGPWSQPRSFAVGAQTRLTANPGAGLPGSPVTLEGFSYSPGETVEVRWDNPNVLLGALPTDNSGRFTLNAAVPPGAPVGAHIIRGLGVTSGRVAAAGYTVNSPTPPGQPTLAGRVILQAMGTPATDPSENRWANYPVNVTIYPAGGSTPHSAATVGLDRLGAFGVMLPDLPAGAYDIKVKAAHTLSNKRNNVQLPQPPGAPAIDFGTLKAGDLSNDDAFSALDYSMLVTNFGSGPGPIVLSSLWSGLTPAQMTVGTGPDQVEAGAVIALNITLRAGGQPVDSVSAALRFPPDLLVAVNPAGAAVSKLGRSAAFPVTLANRVDNREGAVEFGAGRLPDADPLTGDITVATVYFKALTRLAAPLPVILIPNGEVASEAYYQGRPLTER